MEFTDRVNAHKSQFINIIDNAEFTKSNQPITSGQWFESVVESLRSLRGINKKLFILGNGASASISDHFAADISKNALIPTFSNTEAALITGFSNDYGYENAQVEILKRKMYNGDGVILISSSGNSKNLINVANFVSVVMNNSIIITLTAFKPDNSLRNLGHYNLYIPKISYSYAESAHAYYLHMLTDFLFDDDIS